MCTEVSKIAVTLCAGVLVEVLTPGIMPTSSQHFRGCRSTAFQQDQSSC